MRRVSRRIIRYHRLIVDEPEGLVDVEYSGEYQLWSEDLLERAPHLDELVVPG